MLGRKIIFEIHRLKDEGLSQRQIAKKLRISRPAVGKYLDNPEQVFDSSKSKRASKLEPYYDDIDEYLKEYPDVKAPVVLQRLRDKGFDGQVTIVRKYLREKRGEMNKPKAYIRFESQPGEKIQIDWGHFGSLPYGNTKRKLYALVMTECYSRMIYVCFMHSQKQESLHQAMMDGFKFFGGSPKQIVVDNMLTAVIERIGKIIRFNDKFLDFLRILKIVPYACNPGAPHEKGKVESGVKYVRINFWPLRKFTDLYDVQSQSYVWRDRIANVRIHETTGERPIDRFANVTLRPLPEFLPDPREVAHPLVNPFFEVKFDANTYTVPPRMIGKRVTLKADDKTVTIYYKDKKIATHKRSWKRKKRVENLIHVMQVKRVQKGLWEDKEIRQFTSIGPEAVEYLKALAKAGQPVKKSVARLLELKDEYGTESLIHVIKKAMSYKAYSMDYIENIILQEMTPETNHQPVKLKNEALNRIRLEEPCLEDYDAYAVKKAKGENK